ncbi:MAG: hypothetical protein J5993_00130 [Clostridia bacterium]|nr:hypothetical protein [Clostridia bacterium]
MLKYNKGRFELEYLSFAIPDNMYLTTSNEVELEDGLELFTEDWKVRITVAGNEIAESAIESIESLFDEELSHKKIGEITELHKAGLDGCYVVYENDKLIHIEACLNTPNIEDCHTFMIWARTEKKYGEEEVSRMMRLYTYILDSIEVRK